MSNLVVAVAVDDREIAVVVCGGGRRGGKATDSKPQIWYNSG
jgi:hypothetical protein